MRIPLLIPEVRELLQEGKLDDLRSVLEEMHPTDAAAILSALNIEEIASILAALPTEIERDVFHYIDPEVQEAYVAGAGRERVRAALGLMLSDDRAEFLDRLDDRVRDRLIPMLPSAARDDLMRRETFREDQVGSFLTTDYAVLNPALTVANAIRALRHQAPKKETIYYSYVVDRKGLLVGFISLRDLLLADDATLVSDVMKTELVSIKPEADQEEAAHIIRDYDLLALPVIDASGRLVGIVTHDDAVDIVQEEAQEDFEKMAGLTGHGIEAGDYDYLEEPIWRQIRRRAPVLCLLALFWVVTSGVIKGFEEHIEGNMLLLALLPMVMATGGMVGTQASALVIRALTVSDDEKEAIMPFVWKELRVAGLMALLLAVIAFIDTVVVSRIETQPDPLDLVIRSGAVIGGAMLAHVLSAAMLGALTPLIVKKLRGDPAMISTPAVTAIADLTGATIYLVLVTLLLTRPGG
ncbi:MAG: magnesium transporter [Planctomycetes bacterium]|nr:magnesium transporter [Planctomycetota bacterium]